MATTVNGHGPSDPFSKMEEFRQADLERERFLRNLVEDFQELQDLYNVKCSDCQNEIDSRRIWQKRAQEAEAELDRLNRQLQASPFVLALIDGDGVIFQDAFLKAAGEGGSDAAHELHSQLKQLVHDRHPKLGHARIMVQVYANFEGLSKKLASVGIIRSPSDLNEFARAFSLNQPLFSMIDVGWGKERADHKIREMFSLFVDHVQCRHIIFGGCHDKGYLVTLDAYKRDFEIAQKLTLLETTPATSEYSRLGFNITRFASVFREEPLPERYVDTYSRPETIAPPPGFPPQRQYSQPEPVTASLPAPSRSVTTAVSPAISAATPLRKASSEASTTSPVPPAARSASNISNKENTWTTITKNPAPIISIAPTKTADGHTDAKGRKVIFVNANDQRIDPKLPRADPIAVNRLHARIKEHKICNNFHLLGECPNGAQKYCAFQHGERLGAKEQLALRAKARERPCGSSSDCRDVDCLSGHHCPRGERCDYGYCHFGDLHKIDMEVQLKVFEDGTCEAVH